MKTEHKNTDKNIFKAHPVMLLRFLKPFLFVLVIPLLKGAVQYLIYRRITGVWAMEALAFSVIFIIALLRLLAFSVSCENDIITVKSGLVLRNRAEISFGALSCVSVSQNPLDMIFSSVTYNINTEAGASGKADFCLKLSKSDARRLSALLYSGKRPVSIKFSPARVAALSAASSSFLTGLLVGVPVIKYSGNLLGVSIADMLIDRIDLISQKFNNYFPPAVNAITLLFILFYGISFVAAFFKNMNFTIAVGKNELESRSGFITKHHTVFKKSSINCILVEQTPLMRLLGLFTMSAAVGGYGDAKGERPAVIPCGNRKEIDIQLKVMFPFKTGNENIIRPKITGKNKLRYMFMPCVWYITIAAAVVAVALFARHFLRFALFLAAVAAAVNTYYLFTCRTEVRKGRIELGESVSVFSTRRMSLREMHFKAANLGEIRLTETPADRKHGTCKVRFTVGGESAESIRIRNIDKSRITAIF